MAEAAWYSVDKAISLQPEHISAYALTLKKALICQTQREGLLVGLTDDDEAMQYEWVRQRLLNSEYNSMKYQTLRWMGGLLAITGVIGSVPSLGVGLSAHSFIGERFGMLKILKPICRS